MCDILLMVNSNKPVLLTVCEIFSHIELENPRFRLLYSDCRPPGGGTPNNVAICTLLKSTSSKLQFCCRQYGSISSFVSPLLPPKSAKSLETQRKTYSNSIQKSSILVPEVENHYFRPLHSDYIPLADERPAIYIPEKYI